MTKEYLTKNPGQTRAVGEEIAKKILSFKKRETATVIALRGELGGGKTTFLQGLAKGLGIKDRVLSPTFIVMRRSGNFYHIDCYRLKSSKDLAALGIEEVFSDPKNIVAIEWAEKVKRILPRDAITVEFDFIDENTRRITVL